MSGDAAPDGSIVIAGFEIGDAAGSGILIPDFVKDLPRRRAVPRELGACPVIWLMRRLGDRWTLPVLAQLSEGPKRFAKLQKALGSVSHRMLIRALKMLERDGMVERSEGTGVPPQVTYTLSPLGHSLMEQMGVFRCWMRVNEAAILDANRRYDDRTGQG